MELEGSIKNYEWGQLGDKSEVANLVKAKNAIFEIEKDVPYAELWMGDHESGPSVIKETGEPLSQVYKHRLPYLFKVLSIRTALSIQVHPNKKEAELLHKEKPDIYKDANHKPELAIALTPFKALCGFRPYSQIYQFCQELPPLKELLGGEEVISNLSCCSTSDLKNCYKTIMTADPATIASVIEAIEKDCAEVLVKYNLKDTFSEINSDFPGDVGVLSLFFLNLLSLEPGESIFLRANEIHAYLSGDCVECMACSDNVIRAGLTQKFKDVDQLLESLIYAGAPASSKLFKPKEYDTNTNLFAPPVPDFAVLEISSSSTESQTLKLPESPGILLVLKGERTLHLQGRDDIDLQRGSIVFIPPENMKRIEFLNTNNSRNFKAYLATQNLFKN